MIGRLGEWRDERRKGDGCGDAMFNIINISIIIAAVIIFLNNNIIIVGVDVLVRTCCCNCW
jgi:hypothetical protein